jgi:hypothetical protein
MILFYLAQLNAPEHRKLDYSKPVFTAGSSVVCPDSLLIDSREDHDVNAVFDVFMAFFHRAEKAKALGCEELREGIPVYAAHRMAAPFNDFVAISWSTGAISNSFTMEGNLKNEEVPSIESAVPSAPTTASDPIESVKAEFQQELPTLDASKSNVRWFPVPALNPGVDGTQKDALLVTPYGPCAIRANDSVGTGYVVTSIFIFSGTNHPSEVLGTYATRASATEAAEEYCKKWYMSEQSRPHDAGAEDHFGLPQILNRHPPPCCRRHHPRAPMLLIQTMEMLRLSQRRDRPRRMQFQLFQKNI